MIPALTVAGRAAADIVKALQTIPEITATADPGAVLANLPAAVLGPPRLRWEGASNEQPTSAQFLVYLVVNADADTVERLLALVEAVVETLDAQTDGVVIQADPGVFPSGTVSLPCYEIQVEVSLS